METQLKDSNGTPLYPKIDVNSNAQALFDIIYPVNSTYIQLPSTLSPQELYNNNIITSQWKKLYYNGCFFRGENNPEADASKEAKEFNGGEQAEALPNIKGSVYCGGNYGGIHGLSPSFSGAFKKSVTRGNAAWDGSHAASFDLNLDASGYNPIYKDNAHVTPRNYTIAIWERIS